MDDIVQLDGGLKALRYGSNGGQWDNRALIRVAAFLTGVDIDSATITEDQILDVVRPVEAFWKPEQNLADIEVITGKRILGMTLGQWLVKYPTGLYRVVSHNDYMSQVGPAQPAPTLRQDLQHVLNKHSVDARLGVADFILASEVDNHLTNLAHMLSAKRKYEGTS